MEEVKYFDNIYQMNRKTTKEKYDNMEQQINIFVDYIKSLNLSPIEEIMLVYDRAKLFQFAKGDKTNDSRQLSEVIANKKAVCAGYTNFFNECLTRLGHKNCAVESYVNGTSHMHSLVEVDDDKYGIHGVYNFDPTFDSLDKEESDRTISYAYFGRSMEEISQLKDKRDPRGISIALMQGIDGKEDEILEEIPLRTMNIVNGFFPSEENEEIMQEIYKNGSNTEFWKKINERFLFQICGLGTKARHSDNISLETLEEIIRNVARAKNPRITDEELDTKMKKIKEFNNGKFDKEYNDKRLQFKIIPEDYVSKENYPEVLKEIEEIYKSKGDSEKLKTIIEFTNGQQQQVKYRIESEKEDGSETLLEHTFDDSYDTSKKIIVPAIKCIAKQLKFISGEILRPEYLNLNIRSFIANFLDGSSMSIIDGNIQLLRQIKDYLKVYSFPQGQGQNKDDQDERM